MSIVIISLNTRLGEYCDVIGVAQAATVTLGIKRLAKVIDRAKKFEYTQ